MPRKEQESVAVVSLCVGVCALVLAVFASLENAFSLRGGSNPELVTQSRWLPHRGGEPVRALTWLFSKMGAWGEEKGKDAATLCE